MYLYYLFANIGAIYYVESIINQIDKKGGCFEIIIHKNHTYYADRTEKGRTIYLVPALFFCCKIA